MSRNRPSASRPTTSRYVRSSITSDTCSLLLKTRQQSARGDINPIALQQCSGYCRGLPDIALHQLVEHIRGVVVAEEIVAPFIGNAVCTQVRTGQGSEAHIGSIGQREVLLQVLANTPGKSRAGPLCRDSNGQLLAAKDGGHNE